MYSRVEIRNSGRVLQSSSDFLCLADKRIWIHKYNFHVLAKPIEENQFPNRNRGLQVRLVSVLRVGVLLCLCLGPKENHIGRINKSSNCCLCRGICPNESLLELSFFSPRTTLGKMKMKIRCDFSSHLEMKSTFRIIMLRWWNRMGILIFMNKSWGEGDDPIRRIVKNRLLPIHPTVELSRTNQLIL